MVGSPVHSPSPITPIQKDAIADVRLAQRQRPRRSSFCFSSCLCPIGQRIVCAKREEVRRRKKGRMMGPCPQSLAMDAAMVISSLWARPFTQGRPGRSYVLTLPQASAFLPYICRCVMCREGGRDEGVRGRRLLMEVNAQILFPRMLILFYSRSAVNPEIFHPYARNVAG